MNFLPNLFKKNTLEETLFMAKFSLFPVEEEKSELEKLMSDNEDEYSEFIQTEIDYFLGHRRTLKEFHNWIGKKTIELSRNGKFIAIPVYIKIERNRL